MIYLKKERKKQLLLFFSDRLSTDDSHGTSITVIPCEFCNEQQTSENVTRHQVEFFLQFFCN
jgi:hypothetical protein